MKIMGSTGYIVYPIMLKQPVLWNYRKAFYRTTEVPVEKQHSERMGTTLQDAVYTWIERPLDDPVSSGGRVCGSGNQGGSRGNNTVVTFNDSLQDLFSCTWSPGPTVTRLPEDTVKVALYLTWLCCQGTLDPLFLGARRQEEESSYNSHVDRDL